MDLMRTFRRAYGRLYGNYDYSSHVLAFHDYNMIYMAVPKAANSSIKSALWQLLSQDVVSTVGGAEDEDRISARHRNELFRRDIRLMKHQVSKYPSYLSFTFVRNPWDRLVSCYMDKIRSSARKEDGSFYRKDDKAMYSNSSLRPQMPFDEFVESVCKTPDRRSNRHFRSQHTFFQDRKGNLLVSEIGCFERLSEDFDRIIQLVGAQQISLPHVRRSDRGDYREFYTPKLRDMVARRYATDISLLEYKF